MKERERIENKIVRLKQCEKELQEILTDDLKKIKGRIDQVKKATIVAGMLSLLIYWTHRTLAKSPNKKRRVDSSQERRSSTWKRLFSIASPYVADAIIKYVSKRTK